ncbi:MAG: hypothetical protein VYA67_21860 [Actinomycetota bacterium]|nr:hypothetical protein [Actinomycetota bacterium]
MQFLSKFLSKVKAALSALKSYLSTPQFNSTRATLYAASSAVLIALVAQGKLSQDRADLIGAVAAAAFSPLLAAIFAPSGLRTWLFGLLGPAQGLLVAVGGANNLWVVLIGAVVSSVLSTSIASANVYRANTGPTS